MLEAVDLTFAHPGQAAPYCFSFIAQGGEVTAVSGASGAGKSTLFDLLAGFLEPGTGRLRLDGQDLLGLPPEARPVSLLLQSDNLFDHLSALDNVLLGLPRGTPKADGRSRAVAALDDVGLPGIGGRSPRPFRAGRSSAWPWPAPCCGTGRCCCSTSPSRRSTTRRGAAHGIWWGR